MATVRKREGKHGPSYQIRSSCGYDIHGKQVVKSMTWKPPLGMTLKQMEKEAHRQAVLFDERCAAGATGDGGMKFEAFSALWFKEYAEPTLKARTVDTYHQRESRTYAAIGHIRLDKLTTRHIQDFINSLCEDEQNKNTGGKLSPATVKGYVAFVSSVLDYAIKMGAIQDNPCSRVTLPTPEHKEKEVYTLEEAQRFLDSLEQASLEYQAFFTLAIFGGFRRGELLGLEWPDIDFDGQIITICRTSQYTKERGIFTDTTKTRGSQRSIKLPADVFTLLRRYRAEQAQRRLLLGDRWTAGDKLFTNTAGGPLNPKSPYAWLKLFCERTGQRFLGVHMFRHLSATLLIGGGADVRSVSAVLGHSQTSTTMNIYAHSIAEAQARASDILESLLDSRKKGVC